MLATVLAASFVLSPSMLVAPEAAHFPGTIYETKHRARLEQRALARWPGPTGLQRLWECPELGVSQRVALLLGGAAFHDPQLLPVYRQALGSEDLRVRQAAAYGFRVSIGDALPNVSAGVSTEQAAALADEVTAVEQTLRTQPLVAMWLNSMLRTEGSALPGYSGVYFTRSATACVFAVESVVSSHDLQLLVQAYQASEHLPNRISLLRLIESYAMQRFLILPQGARAAWGLKDYEEALQRLDNWIERWFTTPCGFDHPRQLREAFRELGADPVDPFAPDACGLWLRLLVNSARAWWPQAAEQLYLCGGPPVRLSVFRADTTENDTRRSSLLKWYGVRSVQ